MDSITEIVAKNTVQLSQLLGANLTIEKNLPDSYIQLYYNRNYIARMIEGCNAINVIILFIAFVASFSGKLKPTLLFVFGGSVIIYILNIVRIAALCVLMYHFPEWENFLHGVIFPLFIYGVVFLLWIIWVFKFSSYVQNVAKT